MTKGRNDGTVSSAAAAMRTIAAYRLKQVQQHLRATAAPEATAEAVPGTSVKQSAPTVPKPAFTGVKPLGGLAKKRSIPKPADPGAESELMRLLEGFDMQGEK